MRSTERLAPAAVIAVVLAGMVGMASSHGRKLASTSAQQLQQPAASGSRFKEPDPIEFGEHAGFVQIFDGATLKGWDGNPAVWRVENGILVGESTREKPSGNSYISYHGNDGGVSKDFDLKLEIKVEDGGGSGIQYRSQVGLPWLRTRPGDPPINLNWMMTGPQADFWYPVNPRNFAWTGQFYSENTDAGIIAWRGQVVNAAAGRSPRLVGNIADRSALGGFVRINDWNQYLIMARGGTFIHIINGQLMAVLIDDDPASSNNKAGLIGFEIEGVPCKVSIRDVWLKRLS